MSSERTQPPSIAPKKPPTSRPAATGADEAGSARPASGPVSAGATSGGSLSMGERIRRGADALRGAVTDAGPQAARPAEPVGGGRPTISSGPVSGGAVRTESSRPASSGGPRKVRLAIARIDPWSVMKLSFLLSVAIGIMIVVSAAVVWQTLDSMAVFTSVNETIATIADDPEFFDLLEYAAFPRVLSLATMIAVVDVVLLTALSTIGAFLYNIVAALVGGITVTLTDD